MVFIKTQFTYELEKNNKLTFLVVLLKCNKDTVETTVYKKPTNSDIYLNWKSFSHCSWKPSTFKTIIRRVYLISSTSDFLREELDRSHRLCIRKV